VIQERIEQRDVVHIDVLMALRAAIDEVREMANLDGTSARLHGALRGLVDALDERLGAARAA
jgi:hypothetical protein